MAIKFNVRDFVDVTITKRAVSRRFVYDTVIYNVGVGSGLTDGAYYANVSVAASGDGSTKEKAISYKKATSDTEFYKWADLFFRNGGKYIHVVSAMQLSTDGEWEAKLESGNKPIPLDELVVFKQGLVTSTGSGINQKIFLVGEARQTESGYEGIAQFIVAQTFTAANVASAAVAAYFTKIDLNSIDSVKDCMFTKVNCTDAEYADYNSATTVSDYNTFITVGYLAGAYRLLGGNDSLGNDLTNVWAKIVLTQALTNDLLVLLTSKIRLDSNGIASVKAACSRVLNRFVTNGYISTEKAWTDPDLYIDGELIAAENTPLIDGYKIHVGPITQDNIEKHQIPPVYILYGDQVGVRKIVVTGEVF